MRRNSSANVGSIGLAVMILLILGGTLGWGLNIYKLVTADFESPYKTEIVRGISLVPVIGAFTGYMDIGEENIIEKNSDL